MKKLLKIITGVTLSLAMAIGVGIGVASNNKKAEPVYADNGVMAAGSNSSSATVNTKSAIKCGSSSNKGSMTITLANANAATLNVYVGGWNNDTGRTIDVSISGGATISPTSFDVSNESGFNGSGSSFTVSDESIHLKQFTLSNAPANTVVTFTAKNASKNRFIVWGASYTTSSGGGNNPTLSSIAINGSMTKTSYTTAEAWDPTGLTVTGTYSDASSSDVTASATFSYYSNEGMTSAVATPSALGAGNDQTIYIKATVSDKTASKSQSVSVSAVTYTVTYHDTNKTSGSAPTDNNAYQDGAPVTVLGNTGTLARTGYTWSGWSINENGSGTAYGPTYTTTYTVASSNINFYPIWVKTLPESGTFSLTGSNPNFGNYGTDVAYTIEEDNTPDTRFGIKATNVTKNSGNIQFKASSGVLYSTTPLSYLRSVVVSGTGNTDAVITYGTAENGGCTESNIGTRNTYFKILNGAGNARYWTITVTYALEDPAALTDIVITAGADSVKKTYDDGESFDPTGLVIKAKWNGVLDNDNDVVGDVVWTPNPLTAGTTSVTGTYTSGPNSATVTISGLTVSAPAFVHSYASNSVYNETSGSSSDVRTHTPTSGPEYITLGGYNYSGNDGCMSFLNVDGMYLGNNEEYSVASVKKYIRKIVITTTANVTSSLTMTEGQTALPSSSPVAPAVSADNKTLTYVFSSNISFFKLAKSGTGYVNLKSISVYLGSNVPVIDSVSASVNAGTYYAGTTLSASDFNVTVNWTEGKAATHPTEGFTWTVNGVANGTLNEINDNVVVVTYENEHSNEIYVVGSPAPAKDIIESTAQTQAALSYHYSRNDHLVSDVLTRELTGVPAKTDYVSWDSVSATTSAVYAGRSAGGNDTLQLNSNNSDKGIITTTSGGKAKSVTVAWNSNTGNGRVLNVYGKNTAYTAVSQLYDEGTAGTLIGTIIYGTSTTLAINADYEYVAIKSNSGAAYLDSIQIEWATAAPTYTYTNTKIQFGAYVSQTLWNRLNTSSTIVEYGFLLSTETFLHTDDPNDDESLKLWYDMADQISVKKFYQEVDDEGDLPYTLLASEHAEISEDQYVWRLTKGISNSKLTEQYVAVAYIKTANGDIVFLNQIKKSAKDLAGDMLPSKGNAYAEGSLYNLAHLGE